jgi:hypothetical protein
VCVGNHRSENRRADRASAVKILSASVYQGFRPTLAAEYLSEKHGIEANRETVLKWLIDAKLWRAKQDRVKQVRGWPVSAIGWTGAGRSCI